MRNHFLAFLLCCVTAAAFYSAAAFSAASTGARGVTATVVGDASAYLEIEENAASPHAPFASTTGTPAKLTIDFGSAAGVTGTGVNPNATYYFDDIVTITNYGTETVSVHVNATSAAGVIHVCHKTTSGAMHNGCYSAAGSGQSLAVGATHYLGIGVNSTNVGSISGSIYVVAQRA